MTITLRASKLIDGTGRDPVESAAVTIDGGRIRALDGSASAGTPPASDLRARRVHAARGRAWPRVRARAQGSVAWRVAAPCFHVSSDPCSRRDCAVNSVVEATITSPKMRPATLFMRISVRKSAMGAL